MRRNVIFFVAAFFFSFSAMAWGEQASSAQASSQAGNPTSASPARDCSGDFDSLIESRQAVDRGQRTREAQSDPAGASETDDAAPSGVNLEQDLKILDQRQSELAQCILAADVHGPAQDSPGGCFGELILNFEMRHDGEPERDIPIGRLPGSSAFFYESGMTIDADGAPNAYHPDNSGLDDLANAGTPGRWEGLAKDAYGEPFIQGPDDPFPGYYVSETALADRSKPVNDPTRYVDASRIPFVVLPGWMARQLGARPGDFAAVFNPLNGKSSYAIFGDEGPSDRIGEGSVALAENLGIRSDARNGGARRGILYLVFPGSGNGRPRTIEEINAEGQKLLQVWEGSIPLVACPVQQPARAHEGSQTTN
jgi:glycosyl hydrolase group 75 (putative chitosanase)